MNVNVYNCIELHMVVVMMLHSETLETETPVGHSLGSWSLGGHADAA